MRNIEQPSLSDLIAEHGHSSSTDWLDARYQHWYLPYRPSGSKFTPVQGYMIQGSYIFAWGNPIVSSSAVFPSFIDHFSAFADSQSRILVWLCVNQEFQDVLGSKFGWSTVSCIKEDLIDPTHVLHMMSKKECGRIKNLRNSLSKAYKSGLMVEEVPKEYLVESNQRVCIDEGIAKWKESKKGIQIASTTVNPWLDIEHRRYWLARLDSTVVGILILTPIHHGHWQIVNVVPFNSSPKGTSEALIHAVLKAIEAEQDTLDESTSSLHSDSTGDSIPYPNYQISIGDATSTPGLAQSIPKARNTS
uniref:Uncharacterized protein n=1 Tax=Psilocybe cubensis TaxID=181762 RepID=A0A8H8CHP2_PSICU